MSSGTIGLLYEPRRMLRAARRDQIREEIRCAKRVRMSTAPRLAAREQGTLTTGRAIRPQQLSDRRATAKGVTVASRTRIGLRRFAIWIGAQAHALSKLA